jgi:hypothetical protein
MRGFRPVSHAVTSNTRNQECLGPDYCKALRDGSDRILMFSYIFMFPGPVRACEKPPLTEFRDSHQLITGGVGETSHPCHLFKD